MSTLLRGVLVTACPRAVSASVLWNKIGTHNENDGIGKLPEQPYLLLHLRAFPARRCRRETKYF